MARTAGWWGSPTCSQAPEAVGGLWGVHSPVLCIFSHLGGRGRRQEFGVLEPLIGVWFGLV